MIRRPPRSTRTDTLFPYTTLFRSTGLNRCIESPCNVNYSKEQGREEALNKCESAPCRMDGPSPRERRHEAILDAAEALFIEQGYDRTSLAEIVRRSGGSLATLYELFGNKQGLLHAIAIRWRDETMLERMERAPDDTQDR